MTEGGGDFHFSISHRNTDGRDVKRVYRKGYEVQTEKGPVFISDSDIRWAAYTGNGIVGKLRELEAEAYPPTPEDQFLEAIERYVWG